MFRKTFILIVSLIFILNVNTVYASDNIVAFTGEVSEKEVIDRSGEQAFLTKQWYDLKFEIAPRNTSGTLKMQEVDSQEYLLALKEVRFPLEAAGEYKLYFLAHKLKDQFSTLALSFGDGSVVVFGNYGSLPQEKLHRLAVHELGHQIDFRLMTDAKWQEYRELRGIEDQNVYNDYTDVYQNRPQEIFAEDFRLIFGGEKARLTEHLNSDLKSPSEMPELKEFFLSLTEQGA